MTPELGSITPAAARSLLVGLFNAAFYRTEAGIAEGIDAFDHYLRKGALLRPNPLFDPAWYLAHNPSARHPLLHYAVIGEPDGRDPSPLFDVAWYRKTYGVERPLAHYLLHRFGPFSPVPEFDAAYYLSVYPDVAAARMDPFQHYLHFGWRHFLKPCSGFNPKLYANRNMRDSRGANPLIHLRTRGASSTAPLPTGPFAASRGFTRPGVRYELLAPPASGGAKTLALAFHLPQFHRIAENDAFWGEGFTEWTLLARGQSRFEGHYQPRIPGALGFYDLSDPQALRAQGALAKSAGIGGFVFYHYDFGGRRLLQKPVELFLDCPDIDIGFCLMWANENWTRRWDGAEDEVLIEQNYHPAHESLRLADFARHFRDPRYIRFGGRPLLMVYRAGLIPDTAATLSRWRRIFEAEHGEHPIFVMAQTFDDTDPRPLGFDAAIEFPPHKLTRALPQIFGALDIHDEAFEADVFAYEDVVTASLMENEPDFPLIKTVVPSWDNDARRSGRGLTLVGATPLKYERWLAELISRARPVFGVRLVAINAWNEWSEGAYLEPDVHFGAAYINATSRALYNAPAPQTSELAKVSAFVLHSDGPFSAERLRSLFEQTHPIAEIVVLDAGEDSLDIVEAEACAANRNVALGLGVTGALAEVAEIARGELIWLVASHGRSAPTALAALIAALIAEPNAVAACSGSQPVDANGLCIYVAPNPLKRALEPFAYVDSIFDGPAFAARLSQLPCPSSSLWRRDALTNALAKCHEGRADIAHLFHQAATAPQARFAFVADALDFISHSENTPD